MFDTSENEASHFDISISTAGLRQVELVYPSD